MRVRAVAVAVLGLGACGGGQPPATPVPTPASVASAPPPQVPVVPPPAPEPVVTPPAERRALLWEELWSAPKLGGYYRDDNYPGCRGALTDPDVGFSGSVLWGNDWALINEPLAKSSVSFRDGNMYVDSLQAAMGFAMLSAARFDNTKKLVLETSVLLQHDQGSWLGVTFINGEGDYRELAVYWDGAVRVGIWRPCELTRLPAAVVQDEAITLRLEYRPNIGWKFYADNVLVHEESIEYLNAALVGPPAVGLYIVNVGAESRQQSSGYVRAVVGPVRVYELQ